MDTSLFQPLNAWPMSWPGGLSRIVEARPLAVRLECGPWYSGVSLDKLQAYRDARQLNTIKLGADVELVLIRDLETLLRQLASGEEPHPEPLPRPPRRRRLPLSPRRKQLRRRPQASGAAPPLP